MKKTIAVEYEVSVRAKYSTFLTMPIGRLKARVAAVNVTTLNWSPITIGKPK
jgi:hypothetical protein